MDELQQRRLDRLNNEYKPHEVDPPVFSSKRLFWIVFGIGVMMVSYALLGPDL